MFISKLMVFGTINHGSLFSDVPKVVNTSAFPVPMPVNVIDRMIEGSDDHQGILNSEKVKIQGLGADGQVVKTWCYTLPNVSLETPKAKGVKGETKTAKGTATPKAKEEKAKVVGAPHIRKEGQVIAFFHSAPHAPSKKELKQVANAPKTSLPINGWKDGERGFGGFSIAVKAHKGNEVLPCVSPGMASAPFIPSESKVECTLYKANGESVTFPIKQGLFTSAKSRGIALLTDDPKLKDMSEKQREAAIAKGARVADPFADIDIYIKRLIGDSLIGKTDLTQSAKAGQYRKEATEVTQAAADAGLFISDGPVFYTRAIVTWQTKEGPETLELTRQDCLLAEKACKSDPFKRKNNAVMSKRIIPFGAKSISFEPTIKSSRASFSRG